MRATVPVPVTNPYPYHYKSIFRSTPQLRQHRLPVLLPSRRRSRRRGLRPAADERVRPPPRGRRPGGRVLRRRVRLLPGVLRDPLHGVRGGVRGGGEAGRVDRVEDEQGCGMNYSYKDFVNILRKVAKAESLWSINSHLF